MKNNILDKFYTNPIVCDKLVKYLFGMFRNRKDSEFIEPSAGSGNFIDVLIKNGIDSKKIHAYDIEPLLNIKIEKTDYLKLSLKYKKNRIIIGNPPFGKNGNLAIQFLNKALKEADIVAFIVPLTFKRYSVQRKIKSEAKLINEINISSNSFLVNNREYNINCVFQVWVNPIVKTFLTDIRQRNNPKTKIDGLKTFIYNNTKTTKKYFDKSKYKWDFAVVRQGYYDYNVKIFDPNELKSNRQYFFIKVEDSSLQKYVDSVDFNKLSKSNTIIKGFSTTDFILELYRLKEMDLL